MATQTVLPRWRGFNLLDAFTTRSDGNFHEEDFQWIRDWGFNFVRIPACYTLWIENDDAYQLHEPMLEKMDRVVQLGQKYGIHVCLNFHRGPGYSVNHERKEPYSLWKDEKALRAFCFHWATFARRYQGIPSAQLSFNLINEPANEQYDGMKRSEYEHVVRQATAAIREVDANRLIIADGTNWANTPLPELNDLNIAQACRAYAPMNITHYKAGWAGGADWPEPSWPGKMIDGIYWDRAQLEAHYKPWEDLARQGVGVICGEGGAFLFTPHKVVLAWMRNVLEILSAHNIGLALWEFRGSFGILDSHRQDVAYKDWHGHKLDQVYLKLLQEFT
jgi:endoglucanase